MTPKKRSMPVDVYVGTRTRAKRLQLGMSQTQLGDMLGITFQQVQKYEKGTNRIGSSRLQQIANALQVPINYFFEGAPGNSGNNKGGTALDSAVTAFLSDADGAKFMAAWLKLKPRQRKHAVAFVRGLAMED